MLKCKVTAAIFLLYRPNLQENDKHSRVSGDHIVVSNSLWHHHMHLHLAVTYPAVAASISKGLASVPQVRIARNKTKKPVMVPSL